ncbi:MAG: hypothetical protein HFJ45_07230 [Clostridia bacterium]|nr:hypothetical protein [Clostridia bacterium]
MKNYLDTINKEVRQYFKILSSEFPIWLLEYIETPEMQRINGISMCCGTDYSKIFNHKQFYSNLEHSIGVALIVWHFTHDKKQTIAGLLHDIATPTFKHCIDFMNGDSEHQESTEARTEQIIRSSKKIMELLHRDGIKVEEVSNYHIYPIADNDTPKLSADRFEYTFSGGLFFNNRHFFDLETIKEIYDNVSILENEDGVPELGFNDFKICEKYIHIISKLWPEWISDEDRTVMQFWADIVKSMNVKGYLTIDDLYNLSEKDVIKKILNCEDKYIRDNFIKFQNATSIYRSDIPIHDKYCISVKAKKRYIIPLTKYNKSVYRIDNVSKLAKSDIDEYFNIKASTYTGFDFDFKPYEIIK